jgi:inner membrane protein
LLGAVTAQLGFRQKIGRDATWVAAAVAVFPDLDILVTPIISLTGGEVGEFDMIVNHRGLTHSLLFVPIFALLAAFVWRRLRAALTARGSPADDNKPPPFLLMYGCVFVALLSHPLLDVCTSYGTQLLMPISNVRSALDAVAIIDLIYTAMLIVTLIVCRLVRRKGIEFGRKSLVIGWVGFMLSTGYLCTGYLMRNLACREASKLLNVHLADEVEARSRPEFHAYPQLGTIFVWRVTAKTEENWSAAKVNVLLPPLAGDFAWQHSETPDNAWIQRARELQDVKIFEWFAMGQLRPTYEKRNGLHIIQFHDMRYGIRSQSLISLWSVRVTFDQRGKLLEIERVRHYPSNGIGSILRQTWTNLFTRT